MRSLPLLLVLSLVLGSPAVAQMVPAAPAVAAPEAGMPQTSAAQNDYTLGVADKVRVTVYNEASLTGEYPVNANGRISMPLIGEVQAAGQTPGGLRQNVERALSDGYLRNPRVAVDVLTFRPFYILGEVTKPGEYPALSGLTVLNAVATAQGFTYRANKKRVFIRRAGETKEQRVPLTSDMLVMPGDTIRIGERFF